MFLNIHNLNNSRAFLGGGGNTVCPRETPAWQKPITNFFNTQQQTPKRKRDEPEDITEACSSSLAVKTSKVLTETDLNKNEEQKTVEKDQINNENDVEKENVDENGKSSVEKENLLEPEVCITEEKKKINYEGLCKWLDLQEEKNK